MTGHWKITNYCLTYWISYRKVIEIRERSKYSEQDKTSSYALVYSPNSYKNDMFSYNISDKTVLTIIEDTFYIMQLKAFLKARERGWKIKKFNFVSEHDAIWEKERSNQIKKPNQTI
jgi:hypothetical protein